MKKAVLVVLIILAVVVIGFLAWIFVSGGPVPQISKFTAERYCAYKGLPKSYVPCTAEFQKAYPDECVNGQRRLCAGRVDNGQCLETSQDRFDECMVNLVSIDTYKKQFCDYIIDQNKKNSCLSR